MNMYRLKKEAVPFFLEKHSTSIYEMSTWEDIGVDIKALDEVEEPYIKYGHRTSETSSTLGGWNEKEGKTFQFTIFFPSVKYMENDKFSNGKVVRELMDKIQGRINYFYEDFVTNE